MSKNIYWVYEGEILDSSLVVEKLAEIVQHVRRNEPDALSYEYFLSQDEKRLSIYERYADGDAVLAHGANMEPYYYFFEEAVKVTIFLVFGPVYEEAKEMLSGFNAEFHSPLEGFARE